MSSLTRITDTIVEDNFTDYAEMLRSVKAGSLLEEYISLNSGFRKITIQFDIT